MIKDTARVLVGWNCNLSCPYCCNRIPEVRERIRVVGLDEIEWKKYRCVCITGGEPMLYGNRVIQICERARRAQVPLVVLYTNGLMMRSAYARELEALGVGAVNVGLHHSDPQTLMLAIARVLVSTLETHLKVRFQLWEGAKDLARPWPGLDVRFWRMDDCERPNEDLFALEEPA